MSSTDVSSTTRYNAEDIEIMEGLDAVRRRPSMYIGGVDARGLHHLLWEIVDNSVDEHIVGHCSDIIVTLHKDGASCSVQDNGRGIPVDMHKKSKKSALETILTTLHSGGKFSSQAYARSGGLHGVGASVVNALSVEMEATIHRDGYEWSQRYKRGKPTTPVKQVRPFRGRGTTIFFRPDEEIFSKTAFHPDTIKQHLEDISYIHAGLKIVFLDEARKEKIEYHHPDGIVTYLDKILAEGQKKATHEQTFSISRDEKNVKIEFVLRWTEATDEQLRSYVNGIRTHAGGTHESGVRSAIGKAVRNHLDVHGIKVKGVTIENSDIREGALGILSVFIADPMFQGQTKEKLNNPEMTAAVESLVRPALETWLSNNPSIADAVVGRIVLAARARQASREAAGEVRRKTSSTRRTNLPGKLLDCRSTNPSESELFIVEGDSAGGTAGMGRDSRFQAVLPLRGKVLNTECLTPAKVLENQEIKDLIETLGTGFGANFDLRRLRYDRIILTMDADSDGYHISTLLLTFFFRHMREIITGQKLFLAQPPLYRIQVGAQTIYAQDDAQKEEVLASLPANRKPEINRFKGLGEMNAQQLKETTLDPKTRMLLAVEVDSLIEADQTFSQLLGKDASERYRIIMSEANLVDDLDL
ncbi:MAG: type IIA DNA topoisomerase subunit B [Candidatus Saccharimonas sp.]|nr:type IIA DNA topoisomerase subunit B [Planctomycetaceae bacterium]